MKVDAIILFPEKRFKHCELKEKLILFSTKEIFKDYICKLDKEKFEINKFKNFFENQINLLLKIKVNVDETTHLASNNRYSLMFYFLDDKGEKKYIRIGADYKTN